MGSAAASCEASRTDAATMPGRRARSAGGSASIERAPMPRAPTALCTVRMYAALVSAMLAGRRAAGPALAPDWMMPHSMSTNCDGGTMGTRQSATASSSPAPSSAPLPAAAAPPLLLCDAADACPLSVLAESARTGDAGAAAALRDARRTPAAATASSCSVISRRDETPAGLPGALLAAGRAPSP